MSSVGLHKDQFNSAPGLYLSAIILETALLDSSEDGLKSANKGR